MTALSEAPAGSLLPRALAVVRGLDEITGGGLPRGRCTLVTGGTGCGNLLLGLQFLAAGEGDAMRRRREPKGRTVQRQAQIATLQR